MATNFSDNDSDRDNLPNDLRPEHLKEFEKRLLEGKITPEELELAKIIQGIEGHQFKQMLKQLHQKFFNEDGSAKTDKLTD